LGFRFTEWIDAERTRVLGIDLVVSAGGGSGSGDSIIVPPFWGTVSSGVTSMIGLVGYVVI